MKWILLILTLGLFVGLPTIAYAEEAPDFGMFLNAVGNQHWPLAVAAGLMLVVWVLRTFVKDKVPSKYIPWVTLTVAILSETGLRMTQFIEAGQPWWQGLVQGLLEGASIGFMAMGWWSSGGKKLPIRK